MRVVVFRGFFFVLCGVAALVPLAERPTRPTPRASANWPESFEGKPLRRVSLSAVEQRFNADFPGEIARFSDGDRDFIFRWITAGTRKVHSAADCFRGLGYAVHSEPVLLDSRGQRWNCLMAFRGPHRLQVRERICTEDETGSWTDVSAWYWSTLLSRSRGPWLAVTIVEDAKG